jgi:hypothetical protein
MLQLKKVRPSLLMIFCLTNQQYKDFGVVAKSLALKTPCQKVWRGNSGSQRQHDQRGKGPGVDYFSMGTRQG